MAASPNVGAQLKDMLHNLKRYEKTTASAGPQSTDLSFMTLLWPLLPLLPPEPPTLLTELLREPENCDVCGTSQGTPLKAYRRNPDGRIKPDDSTSSLSRARRGSDWKTPLDRLMIDIENKMEETLNSIQETTEKNTRLSQKVNEIEKSQMSDMTDTEMLRTLKKLVKVKADQTEKVKVLEVKEQQMKEALTNVIEWARSVDLNNHIPDSEKVYVKSITAEKDILPNDEETMKASKNVTIENIAAEIDTLPNHEETMKASEKVSVGNSATEKNNLPIDEERMRGRS